MFGEGQTSEDRIRSICPLIVVFPDPTLPPTFRFPVNSQFVVIISRDILRTPRPPQRDLSGDSIKDNRMAIISALCLGVSESESVILASACLSTSVGRV